MRVRSSSAQLVGDRTLVRRVAEGEEEADRDRLRVHLGEGLQRNRLHDALRADPLAHADATLERDERLRMVDVEAIEVRAVLTP